MGRLLKIVFYAIILIFVYFWIMTIIKSCDKSEKVTDIEETGQTTEISDEFIEEVDAVGEFEGNEEDEGDLLSGDPIDYEALDEVLDEPEKKTTITSSPVNKSADTRASRPVTTSTSTTSGGGSYFVVAGSFGVRSNAEKMREKLVDKGFEAEIVKFEGSNLDVVISGRYSSQSSANDASGNLKRMGIDNYVHKRKL